MSEQNSGTCVWCGDIHALDPACNQTMGIHITDLETREEELLKRITELEKGTDDPFKHLRAALEAEVSELEEGLRKLIEDDETENAMQHLVRIIGGIDALLPKEGEGDESN